MADNGKVDVSVISQGINLDANPVNQPKGTRRFTLNAVDESTSGDLMSFGNEPSNIIAGNYPTGYVQIGKCYMYDNQNCVFLHNDITKRDSIGIVKNDKYTELINADLNFQINKQIDTEFRIQKANQRVIYFVDAYNDGRTVNLDKLSLHYSKQFNDYLALGGNPNTYTGEKWDVASFALFKSFSQFPVFVDVEILEYGTILPGSYNFAIRYLDTDLNPTHWINVSNTVNIFNDSLSNTYAHIRGSKNVQSDAQYFSRAAKSIKLNLANLDTSYPFYQVAVIQATAVTGNVSRVLLGPQTGTTTSYFIYSGDDANMSEKTIPEILLERTSINSPAHIEQLENRLELAGGRDIPVPFCDFQGYASKITVDVVLKDVILNTVLDDANPKNGNSDFLYVGYMPGQPVSLGIAYLLDTFEVSSAFHIPGVNDNVKSQMKSYKIQSTYQNLHQCVNNNYWGYDSLNEPLTGRNVRHHRLPFRKEWDNGNNTFGIPLVTRDPKAFPITNHKLSVKIELASGQTYPIDDNTNQPVSINYGFTYRLENTPNNITRQGTITNKDMGVEIVLYDDANKPVVVSGGAYIVLDSNCQLATAFPGKFAITYKGPDPHVVTTITNVDTTKIMGIKLSNIIKPHPRVIGFFIVRNELTDADKVVVDNAIIGNTTKYNQYVSFNHFVPEMLNKKKDKKSVYVFSPVHQFTGLKPEFKKIEIEGYYEQTQRYEDGPIVEGDTAVNALRGTLIQDVMAGTSFDPEMNKKKDKDSDGFDLLIGTIAREFEYKVVDNSITDKSLTVVQLFYVNASFYRSHDTEVYYNTSIDNKIAFALFATEINLNSFLGQPEIIDDVYTEYPVSIDTPSYKYRLMYGSLTIDNQTAYSNFITRPYFKEHNNPVMFDQATVMNDITIFNGDAHIGAMSLTSSVFYETQIGDRDKKNKVWQIVGGALLIVGAIVATVLTYGATSPLLGIAVSLGVSMITSGIKFEVMKGMIDNDYPAGLLQTVEDAQVMRQLKAGRTDDTFKWFSGLAGNLYLESYMNIALRSGLTAPGSDFFNAPKPVKIKDFSTYLTDKFTTIDKEHESGRLYKGYAQAEYYDIDRDYHRKSKEKIFYHLPPNYDCCNKEGEEYPNRVWYSEQAFQEETVDNYRVFLPNNYRDIEAELGPITDLFRQDDNLYIQTTEGLWKLRASFQERVTGDIVSYIGTGAFFSIPPVAIRSADLGSGGSKHKWATVRTDKGIFIVSELEGRVYVLGNSQLQSASDEGLSNWFANHLVDYFAKQYEILTGEIFPNQNNPANNHGVGIHSVYDPKYDRVIITKRDYLLINPSAFHLVATSNDVVDGLNFIKSIKMFAIKNTSILTVGDVLDETPEEQIAYPNLTFIPFTDTNYFESKSWTISFSLKNKGYWCSWHSYIPNFYFNNQDGFYAVINDNKFWTHDVTGKYGYFFGIQYPHILEYVVNHNPITTNIIDWFMIQSVARKWNASIQEWFEQRNKIFTKLIAYNERQCTGECIILPKDDSSIDYLPDQVVTSFNQLIASRKETNWTINQLRDFVDDYSQPFLTKEWSNIKSKYFIDKVINPGMINHSKDWFEIESFRDKYLIIRLIFDNFDDVNLLTNYLVETPEPSLR